MLLHEAYNENTLTELESKTCKEKTESYQMMLVSMVVLSSGVDIFLITVLALAAKGFALQGGNSINGMVETTNASKKTRHEGHALRDRKGSNSKDISSKSKKRP